LTMKVMNNEISLFNSKFFLSESSFNLFFIGVGRKKGRKLLELTGFIEKNNLLIEFSAKSMVPYNRHIR
jgi:hypothetical protein